MNVRILEDKSNRLMFEVEGVTHTVSNALKRQLFQNEDIKVAGYHVSHPLVGKPKYVVETKRGADPKKAVLEAIKTLRKNSDDLAKKAAKELK